MTHGLQLGLGRHCRGHQHRERPSLLLWNVFENRKRTFSVFKTDRQPYGLENGPFSGDFFLFSFSGRPPLGNGAPFSINIVIETGAWIWSRHGFPHIVRGNKR